MNNPKFSIIIPTYNRADLVLKTIESALAVDYDNFEVIVVNDGSTDNTAELISAITDHHLFYLERENEERAAARNYGAEKASGDFLYFLDSDDLLLSNHLACAKSFLEKNEVNIFWQPYFLENEIGKRVKPPVNLTKSINKQLIFEGNILSCHGVFLKKSLFAKFKFNTDRALSGSEDMELWIRIAAQYEIKVNPVYTSVLVQHSARSVHNFNEASKLILRKERMIYHLFANDVVVEKFGMWKNVILFNANIYVALHSALNKNISTSISTRYLIKGWKACPNKIFSKKSMSVIKQILKRNFTF